jgi:streptogramin lyase
MNNFILWQGKHREHKYRIVPDLNWCIYRLQRFDPARESWREFLGPGSIARQVFDRAREHLIGNEVNREAREDYIAKLEAKLKANRAKPEPK